MCNKNNRRAFRGELSHNVHQLVGFLRRQHCRRFVEYEDLRVTRERLHDFDPLLNTNGQIFNQGIRINVEAEARRDFINSIPGRREIEGA